MRSKSFKLRNTLYSRHRSYIINLLNLITRLVPGTDLGSLSLIIGDILQHRTIDEPSIANLPPLQQQKRIFQEWAILLNNLWRFMFAKDPDFSCEIRNMIEDSSRIHYPEILNIIYDIYYNLDKDNRQKVIQDLIMLFGFETQNAVTTFKKSDFLNWIVDILFDAASTDIIDIVTQQDYPEGRPETKGLIDLAVKLVAVFLELMWFKTTYERVIFYKFLATFEKNILSRSMEWKKDAKIREIGDPEELIHKLKAKAEVLRVRILTSVLDSLARTDSNTRASYGANPHMLIIRVSNYLFSKISLEEVEEITQSHQPDDGPQSEAINHDMKTPTPLQMHKKFSFPGSGELATPNLEESVHHTMSKANNRPAMNSQQEQQGLLTKCYNYEKFKEFARFDDAKQNWVDEGVFESLKRAMDNYLKYRSFEEFIADVNADKATMTIDLLYKNKQEKQEPKLLVSVMLSVMFAIDWFIETGAIQKIEDTLQLLERLFVNVYALTEIERKNLKKAKSKYLDSVLVFILYFLCDRREKTVWKKRQQPQSVWSPLADLVQKFKNKIWKGLVLTVRFDMDKLLVNKESGGDSLLKSLRAWTHIFIRHFVAKLGC